MKRTLYILYTVCMAAVFCSCTGKSAADAENPSDSLTADVLYADTLIELTQAQADSLDFRLSHHYTNNFNFLVRSDSLCLIPLNTSSADTAFVFRGDVIAVADIRIPSDEADTIWIKVARDQLTMGWIAEDELLANTTPDDTISLIIDFMAIHRMLWMPVMIIPGILVFCLRRQGRRTLPIMRYDEIDSLYPCLLLAVVSAIACLYASIQMYLPEFWQEYYYHPTLNPLILPPLMAALVSLLWLAVIIFVALIMEVYKRFYFLQGLGYMVEMCSLAMLSYLLMAYATQVMAGYVLLPAYLVWLTAITVKSIRHSINQTNYSH